MPFKSSTCKPVSAAKSIALCRSVEAADRYAWHDVRLSVWTLPQLWLPVFAAQHLILLPGNGDQCPGDKEG